MSISILHCRLFARHDIITPLLEDHLHNLARHLIITQIAFLRWPNVGSTLYTTMAHGRHTTLDQCSFDRWRMVG